MKQQRDMLIGLLIQDILSILHQLENEQTQSRLSSLEERICELERLQNLPTNK